MSSGRPMIDMESTELFSSDLTDTIGLVILDTVTFAMALDDGDVLTKRARATISDMSTRHLFAFNLTDCGSYAPLTDRNICGTSPPLPSVGPDVVVSVPPEAFCAATMHLRTIGIETNIG